MQTIVQHVSILSFGKNHSSDFQKLLFVFLRDSVSFPFEKINHCLVNVETLGN